MRYFFHIGYNGTQYSGWQKLPLIDSVQLVIETTLSRILKKPITINGCGRTDARVHASQYFFHVDLDAPLIPELKFRMNKNLPNDIALFEIIPMEGLPHARLDATARTYHYFIHRSKDPFMSGMSSLYQENDLDLQRMAAAAALIKQYDNFRGFYKTASRPRTTICKVTEANLFVDASGDRLKFTITANRFLMGMVRIIVYRLLEVGRKNLSLEEFEQHLMTTVVPKDTKSVYPQGLYLAKVTYPFLDVPSQTKFDQLVNGENTWRKIL